MDLCLRGPGRPARASKARRGLGDWKAIVAHRRRSAALDQRRPAALRSVSVTLSRFRFGRRAEAGVPQIQGLSDLASWGHPCCRRETGWLTWIRWLRCMRSTAMLRPDPLLGTLGRRPL